MKEFVAHLVPRSVVEAMATNEILQIVVFAVFFAVALGALPVPVGRVGAERCHATDAADFNGDGLTDLAVGAPYATVAARVRAGAVGVRYADRRGVPDGAVTSLSQETAGVPDAAEPGDGFGATLAVGDFNEDHCGDLVVGVPDEALGPAPAAAAVATRTRADGNGAVQVFLGSPEGLRAGAMLTVRMLGRAYGTDRFGAAVTAADLDRDGDDDLVVGAPGLAGTGGVAVFGLRGRGLAGVRSITQATSWVRQRALQTDDFGATLTTGDFDGDGRPEIAIGVPGDGQQATGSVTVVDLRARTATSISQAGSALAGDPEPDDRFGAALAAADFDADGRDDLAIGVPGEDLNALPPSVGFGEGAVHVLYGPALTERVPMWTRKTRGAVRYDHFGAALATADLDGDRVADLATGAPGRGLVQVLRGRPGAGLSATGGMVLTSSLGAGAQFGWALAGRRFGPGRAGDLLIGAPGADRFGGVIAVSPGSRRGGGVIRELSRWPGGGLTGYALAP
jgi:hypothetical protein